jgi:hypothetical protein
MGPDGGATDPHLVVAKLPAPLRGRRNPVSSPAANQTPRSPRSPRFEGWRGWVSYEKSKEDKDTWGRNPAAVTKNPPYQLDRMPVAPGAWAEQGFWSRGFFIKKDVIVIRQANVGHGVEEKPSNKWSESPAPTVWTRQQEAPPGNESRHCRLRPPSLTSSSESMLTATRHLLHYCVRPWQDKRRHRGD